MHALPTSPWAVRRPPAPKTPINTQLRSTVQAQIMSLALYLLEPHLEARTFVRYRMRSFASRRTLQPATQLRPRMEVARGEATTLSKYGPCSNMVHSALWSTTFG